MDYDILLREFLINDPNILKHEFKLLHEYYQCKIENCNNEEKYSKYSHEKYNDYVTDEDYMDCWKKCSNNYSSFIKIKQIVYKNSLDIFYKEAIANKNVSEKFVNDFDKFKKMFMKTFMT